MPPRALPVVLLALAPGCRDAFVDPCLVDWQKEGGDYRTRMVTLAGEGIEEHLVLQIAAPWTRGRYDEGAPVAVFLHGGWRTDTVPVDESSEGHLEHTGGIAVVYVNLPGGAEEVSSGGTDDRRGPLARAAVAATLRYAAGLAEDNGGCTIDRRLAVGRADVLVLASFSNGGNLAWSTLGDISLDLPVLAGVASFETPASSQFVNAEPGTSRRASPVYEEGSCDLDDGNGIVCGYAYDGLAFDRQADTLFVDEDGDGRYDEEADFELGAVQDPATATWMQSAQAREAADEQDVAVENRASAEATRAFWDEREGPRGMPEAAARFPALAAIETGTEVDHVMEGAADHPHVTGMIAAMQRAGVAWTRLHPHPDYVVEVNGVDEEYAEVAPNTAVSVGDTSVPMEPEDDALVRGSDYLTAAVMELADRARYGTWDDGTASGTAR